MLAPETKGARAGESITGSPVASPATFYGLDQGPYVATLDRLEDVLTAVDVSAEAQATLRRYYRYARLSLQRPQHVLPSGEVRVWPSQVKMARLLGITTRTLRRHLAELQAAGVLRPEGRTGFPPAILLTPVPTVIQTLMQRPGIVDTLKDMHPESYDTQVVDITRTTGHKCPPPVDKNVLHIKNNVHEKETPVAEHTPDTDAPLPGRAVDEDAMPTRQERLQQVMQQATDETHRVKAMRARKLPHQKMGGGKTSKSATSKADQPAALCEFLRHAIKSGLESAYQPSVTAKDLATMKQLVAETSPETVRQVITWLCTKSQWGQVQKSCRIHAGVPTVGILWGFRATLFPMALEGQTVKRSGGARAVGDVREGDPNSF